MPEIIILNKLNSFKRQNQAGCSSCPAQMQGLFFLLQTTHQTSGGAFPSCIPSPPCRARWKVLSWDPSLNWHFQCKLLAKGISFWKSRNVNEISVDVNYIYWFQLTITIFLKKGNGEFLTVIWKILGKQPLLGKWKNGSIPFLVVFCVFLAAGGASEEIPALLGDPGGCTWVKEPCWGCHGSKGQMLITEVTFENYLLKIM